MFLAGASPALKAVVAMQGSGTAAAIIAQTAPGSEVLQYGATGVISMAFLYFIYALGNGKIVSNATQITEAKILDLATKATEREADALKREDEANKRESSIGDINERLFKVLSARGNSDG